MLALLLASFAMAAPVKTVHFGNVRVSFVIGDVLAQGLGVVAVAHPRDRVITQDGVAGEVVRHGGAQAIQQFSNVMDAAGTLPYRSVHPIAVEHNRQLHAAYLFNVITLEPEASLFFTRVQDLLEARDRLPFDPEQFDRYRRILAALETAAPNTRENWLDVIHPLQRMREDLIRPFEKKLGFSVVAQTIPNILGKLVEVGRTGIAIGPLGAGRSGKLTEIESISAVLAGAKAYASTHLDDPYPLEIRYVLRNQLREVTKQDLLTMVDFALVNGQFLSEAARFEVPGVDWAAVRADYQANEAEAALAAPVASLPARTIGRCAGAITNVSSRVSGRWLGRRQN